MKIPKLNAEDHKLRRALMRRKKNPLTAREAFDFVVGKALDRERGAAK
jgi:hypothetical protein